LKEALKNLFTKDERGLRGFLEDIEDADLVCVPDIMMADVRGSQETVFELQQCVLEYCKDMGDRFAILDVLPRGDGEQAWSTPVGMEDVEKDIEHAIRHWQELPRTEGALYFPWIKDRTGVWVPPCGHVAGIYARTDAQIGVHKAPANEIVEGAMDLATQLTDEQQSRLNDAGVNCLRSFPGRGIRVWGARTLSGQPNWRYVNVRRLFLTLVRWIEHNMNDLVFDSNGPPLWDRVRDRLGSHCSELFQRGALKGRSPDEAFFVKCNAETNPLAVREAGQLICEVGLAVVTPAEFVVVRITQSAAGATATIPTGV
jgi:phage tail sheath protein FI